MTGMFSRLLTAALLGGTLMSAAAALPNDFQNGGNGPNEVVSAQLGIDGPSTNSCPATATLTAWVIQTDPGEVQMMFVRKGQGVGQPVMVDTVKMADGRYLATYSQEMQIHAPIDAEYRLLVGGGSGMASNWVPLRATCAFGVLQELGFGG